MHSTQKGWHWTNPYRFEKTFKFDTDKQATEAYGKIKPYGVIGGITNKHTFGFDMYPDNEIAKELDKVAEEILKTKPIPQKPTQNTPFTDEQEARLQELAQINVLEMTPENMKELNELSLLKSAIFDTEPEKETESNVLTPEIEKKMRDDAQKSEDDLLIQKRKFPIVIEWSEGMHDKNIGVNTLEQLNKKLTQAGFTSNPYDTYIKNKIWLKNNESYFRIDNSKQGKDFNFEKQHIKDYLLENYPNINLSAFETKDPITSSSKPDLGDIDLTLTAGNGHVYLQINENYTATIRKLSDLVDYLETTGDQDENFGEITEISNVSDAFIDNLLEIIERYKNEAEAKEKEVVAMPSPKPTPTPQPSATPMPAKARSPFADDVNNVLKKAMFHYHVGDTISSAIGEGYFFKGSMLKKDNGDTLRIRLDPKRQLNSPNSKFIIIEISLNFKDLIDVKTSYDTFTDSKRQQVVLLDLPDLAIDQMGELDSIFQGYKKQLKENWDNKDKAPTPTPPPTKTTDNADSEKQKAIAIATAKAKAQRIRILKLKSESMAKGGNILLAPNNKKSNLTPEQYKLVRTPEFKAWFGDWENEPKNASKVVDKNGEPLVVYHGTNYDFNEFRKEATAHYFAVDEKYANFVIDKYRGRRDYSKVIPVFLNIRNIFKPRFKIEKNNVALFLNENKGIKNLKDGFVGEEDITEDELAEIKAKNIDIKVYVAFYQNQIKLADGTNTDFDSNNPDIRFAKGGNIKTEKLYSKIDKGEKFTENGIEYTLIEKRDRQKRASGGWHPEKWIYSYSAEIFESEKKPIKYIAKKIAKELNAKIFHESPSGSVYMRLENGKEVRISDHYVMDRDVMNPSVREDYNFVQKYFTDSDINLIVKEIKEGESYEKGGNIGNKNLKEEKEKALKWAKENLAGKSVFCDAIQENVIFTMSGIRHVLERNLS